MMLGPLSKKALYILIVIALILIPAAYGLGTAFFKFAMNRSERGIDGAAAAILIGIIYKVMIYTSFGVYIIILIKVIQSILYHKDISNFLILIPLLPLICIVAYHCYNSYTLKKEQAAYTVDDYVAGVKELKETRYTYEENGEKFVYASMYISSEVACDPILKIYDLHFDESKRKSIVDEAIPILMKDLEGDKLCYCKYYDGTDHYLPTSIEYWEYTAETDTLVVKFAHEDKAMEIKIRY